MESDYDKKLKMQALANVVNKRKQQRQDDYLKAKAAPDKSMNLAKGQLDQDVFRVKGPEGPANLTPERTVVGKTEKINTFGDRQPVISGADFEMKANLRETLKDALQKGDKTMIDKVQRAMSKFGKGMKSIPILGSAIGLASAIGSEDASAAIPILDSAESLGPNKGTLDYRLEQGMLTDEDKEQLKRESLMRMKNSVGN